MTRPLLNPIHPFPARMAPAIVWNRLAAADRGLTVLDPMAGSGTTPATAQRLQHNALAFDSDPLAVNITRAWCSCVDEVEFLQESILVLHGAEHWEREFTGRENSPFADDDETQLFAEFWFDPVARRQLAALATEIRCVRSRDLRSLLWCVFSRMIVTKERGVSLAMDVSHSRPHKVYKTAPVTPFKLWPRAVSAVAQNKFVHNRSRAALPKAKICEGDARRLPLPDASVDIVITSPPYLNAIDYLRGHRLSLIWMGYSISELRRRRAVTVGTETAADFDDDDPEFARAKEAFNSLRNASSFAPRERKMVRRYIADLDAAIAEVARVLRPEGRAIYVVGDCNLRGLFIENSRIVCSLMCSHNLSWVSTRRRELPRNKRYLPPPCSEKAGPRLQARMGEEVVLAFRKR
jgi:SAM-dependent methyltransferase